MQLPNQETHKQTRQFFGPRSQYLLTSALTLLGTIAAIWFSVSAGCFELFGYWPS
jgi:hypothetical protein